MKLNKLAMLVAAAALSAMAGAQTVDNWVSATGITWKNGTNEYCWRDATWTPATAAVGCDGAIVAKPAPAPVAAPKPAPLEKPAPVAAPKPVPRPAPPSVTPGASSLSAAVVAELDTLPEAEEEHEAPVASHLDALTQELEAAKLRKAMASKEEKARLASLNAALGKVEGERAELTARVGKLEECLKKTSEVARLKSAEAAATGRARSLHLRARPGRRPHA